MEEEKIKEQIENKENKGGGCALTCLVVIAVFAIFFASISIFAQFASGKSCKCSNLISRDATINDITITSNENNLVSIEIVVVPKKDISDLEITIKYYTSSGSLLKTVEKDFGDVKKGKRYTKQVYITDFSMSQIFQLDHCKYSVTGGKIV